MPIIQANGVELYYEEAGPSQAPAVVFAHSVGCSIDIWDAQFAALADRYRCIRYDARGHGGSASVDQPTTMADLAADLAGLLDALGIDSAHIAGLSIGGMTAQTFALAHPARVRGLILVATTAEFPTPEFWQNRADTVRRDGMASVVEQLLPRWFTPAYMVREPAVIDGYRQRFNATDPIGYGRCCEAIGSFDLRSEVGAIKAPTLIIVGDQDPATPPAMAEYLREQIAGSELIVISGASHVISVEKPDA